MAYAFTNVGAFAVAIAVEKDDGLTTTLDDLSGLGRTKPLLALAMSVFMFSLIGIPLTGGFMGKWFVFQSAVQGNLTFLTLLGFLTSVVSAFYYLRVVVKMWFENGEADAKVPFPLFGAVGVCVLGTLALGVLPFVVNLAQTVSTVAIK
jgi:NADH-quinone oxidoreductase subunit N